MEAEWVNNIVFWEGFGCVFLRCGWLCLLGLLFDGKVTFIGWLVKITGWCTASLVRVL